jgi:peroxin-6
MTACPSDPFNQAAATKLRNLLSSCITNNSLASSLQLSVLVKGSRGAGKSSLVKSIADETGFNVIIVSRARHELN